MEKKKHFFLFSLFIIKDGSEIRFWEDRWLGNATLREQYSSLYNIVRHKSDGVAKVLEYSAPNVTFGRDLFGPGLHRCPAQA
jgi:hypothetical protein